MNVNAEKSNQTVGAVVRTKKVDDCGAVVAAVHAVSSNARPQDHADEVAVSGVGGGSLDIAVVVVAVVERAFVAVYGVAQLDVGFAEFVAGVAAAVVVDDDVGDLEGRAALLV